MPVKYTHFVIAERGHQKNAAKPPRPAQTGWLVPKEIVLEFERTTPSAPFKGTGIFLDGASTPPLPMRGIRFNPTSSAGAPESFQSVALAQRLGAAESRPGESACCCAPSKYTRSFRS